MSRGRKRIGFIGATQRGKSFQLKRMVEHRCEKYNEPLIVYDQNNQAAWYDYAKISLDDYRRMRSGRYRIVDDDYKKFWDYTFKYFKGGQVIAEDASNYFKPQKEEDIFKNFIALRHPDHDVDISLVFHSIMDTPDYVIRQLNEIILFKTGDSWDKDCSKKIPQHQRDAFKEVFDDVNSDPDPRAWRRFVFLKTETV